MDFFEGKCEIESYLDKFKFYLIVINFNDDPKNDF